MPTLFKVPPVLRYDIVITIIITVIIKALYSLQNITMFRTSHITRKYCGLKLGAERWGPPLV